MASLAIGGDHRREAAGFKRIQRNQRTAAVVGDNGSFRIDHIGRAHWPSWQVEAGRVLEIIDAVLAVAYTGDIPAIDEETVGAITQHDLSVHRSHEREIVGCVTISAPHIRRGPMTPRLAVNINGDPVRMRNLHVVVGGMTICSHRNGHV
jgi:hypothetical protein